MKHKGLQRAFAFLLTLLVAFGSFGGFGLERSAKAAAPAIADQPQDQTVYVGETTTFSVTATGDGLTYQWEVKTTANGEWKNSSSDGNQTHTLTVGSTTTTVAKSGYQFRCVVTSGNESVNSNAATLTVKPNLDRIAITTPPGKTTYVAGESFSNAGMVVTATYKDELNAETSAPVTSYTVDPDGALTTSNDKVTVSYTENGVTKTAIQNITVNAAPQFVPVTDITGVPATATVGTDLTLTGTVAPNNATNQTIVWSMDTTNTLTGASIVNGKLVTTTAGTAKVKATITNGLTASSDYTKSFDITVNPAPIAFVPVTDITGVPTTATVGTDLTLTGTVAPNNATNQTIVWSIDTTNTLTGATIVDGKLRTTTAGTAKVLATITNGASATTNYTKVFSITVSAAPVITIGTMPAGTTYVKQGAITGSLSVAATVNPTSVTPTYQWYSCTDTNKANEAALNGKTSASLTIPTDLTADGNAAKSYYYFCRVSATGAVSKDSTVATVIVNPANAVVSGITITPKTVTIARGGNYEFSATVTGTTGITGAVKWGLLENSASLLSADTELIATTNGVKLVIGMDEANSKVTVRVWSLEDESKYTDATVTVAGPYFIIKSTTPADTTVVKGTNATLGCTIEKLSPSNATVTYQWREVVSGGYADIAGATKSSYTLATSGLAIGDYQFQCLVKATNSAGTTEQLSRIATVTVLNAATYKVTAGAGGTFLKGGTGTLKFTANGNYADFNHVVVDNVTLTENTHYTVASGSTVVTLLNSYLSTLSIGKHTLYVFFDDGGYATTTFYVSGEPYVWDLYADITKGDHVETTWLGKGEKMRLTMYVANPSSTTVKWHFSSRRIGLSSTSTQLYYDNNSGYYVTSIDVTPKYNGNVWVYAENSGETTKKHEFTVVGMNNLPATGQDGRPIRILIGIALTTAAALGALYVWKRKKAL